MNNVKKLKNAEKGKRCFILANGPSITDFDLNKLKNEVVIGMNASPLLENQFNFQHKYYTLSDTRFLSEHEEKYKIATELVSAETIKVFRKEISKHYPTDINNNIFYIPALERDGFSYHLNKGYCYGRTTVMLALQLAYYLGCSEVYLLGVDLTYRNDKPRFYQESTIQIDDSQASIQIMNIFNAVQVLKEKKVSLFNCNPFSLARNYVPFQKFNDLFLGDSYG